MLSGLMACLIGFPCGLFTQGASRLGQSAKQVAVLPAVRTGAAEERRRHLPGCGDMVERLQVERLQVDPAPFESRLHALDQARVGVCSLLDVPRVLVMTNRPGYGNGTSQ